MKIQTVLGKEPGHTIPTDLLHILVKQKPTAFGFAVQCTDDKGNPELSIIREEADAKTLMEKLEMFQENAKDFRALVCFGGPDKFNPDDILPLILKDGDDNPFIALGIEGDFPKYSDLASGRTDEFNLANQIIIPSLLDICELTEGDLSKIVAALGRDSFNNNFLAQIGHRGNLTILPVEGEFINFGKNELGEVYDWGFTSQRHGYGDVKQEPVKEEPVAKKKFSFGPKKIVTETVDKVITTDTATAKTTVQDAATAGTGPRTSVPDTKTIAVRVPSWCHKNEDIKTFYDMVLGKRPDNWRKKLPVIPMENAVVPNTIEELHAWSADRAKANIAAANAKAVTTATTATSAGAPKSGAEIAAIRAKEQEELNTPIISAKDMEKILDIVAKHLDGQGSSMMPPSEIQALEKKLGSFSESVGSKPHEMLNWPVSGLFLLAKADYRAIVLAFLEMRSLWRSTLKVEDLVDTAKPGATTTVTKSGDSTVKTESVSNEAAPTPRRGWFSKKTAA